MNLDLPISDFRDEILDTVSANRVVVIIAETGAGKSTQVPQYLYNDGYNVVATQPRRLAARMVAARVAEEMEFELGTLVGFRTAEEHKDSSETDILFCTDGLQLVRELTGRNKARSVLILDEVHEWNQNMEAIVAWSKLRLESDPSFKLILMSATIEADSLSRYFWNCPVINVPGRPHHVEMREGGDIIEEASALAEAQKNVLIFVPGKAEIDETIRLLRARGVHKMAELLPLHGQLEPHEQARAFEHYNRPKVIVSTNVAQTSVTIDDIDAVVDSGLEKRRDLRDGIEGLYLGETSQADCHQRAGRAGRTKPGEYVLCSDVGLRARNKFPIPEIARTRLDQLVLRLATVGIDASALNFFHAPKKGAIESSKELLWKLGALEYPLDVTAIGEAMSKLPLDVHFARMLVDAEEFDVLEEVITIVACLESQSIRIRPSKGEPHLWRRLTREAGSDLLAELECFNAAEWLEADELVEHGISLKRLQKAVELNSRLRKLYGIQLAHTSGVLNRRAVIRACSKGLVDGLFRQVEDGYVGSDGSLRRVDKNSVIIGAAWVVGVPFDIGVKGRNGSDTILYLINHVSGVKPEWLAESAPHLVRTTTRTISHKKKKSTVVVTTFDGIVIKETAVRTNQRKTRS